MNMEKHISWSDVFNGFSFFPGAGILVSRNAETLLQFIDNTTHAHVLQKYIESPLLLPESRKFDIRSVYLGWYSQHRLLRLLS